MTLYAFARLALAPDSRAAHCDQCAAPLPARFAMGARLHGLRVWLCSPACYHLLKYRWR